MPFAFYLGIAWLQQRGILPGDTSYGNALIAGAVGAAFAALGLLVGRARSRETA